MQTIAIDNRATVLNFRTTQATVSQVLLVAAAVLLPSICHLTGAPVRALLPMHWPVLLAGLVYGWRSGLIIGALSPLVSFALSGMPSVEVLPLMGFEIAAYGLIAGLARQTFKLNGFVSVIIALIVGRVVALAAVVFVSHVSAAQYFTAAMLPGMAAAIAQVVALPFIARKWVNNA